MIHTNLLHIFCLFVFINPKSPRWYDKWRLHFNFNGEAWLLIHGVIVKHTHEQMQTLWGLVKISEWIHGNVHQCASFCVCMTLHASYTVTMHQVVLFSDIHFKFHCCMCMHHFEALMTHGSDYSCAPEHKEAPCFLHRQLPYKTASEKSST